MGGEPDRASCAEDGMIALFLLAVAFENDLGVRCPLLEAVWPRKYRRRRR